MKKLLILLLLLIPMQVDARTMINMGTFKLTAYCPCWSCSQQWKDNTYSGKKATPNHTVAADFISCVAFGKAGEFAEKYLVQGMKIAVSGRLQTGSYTDREGTRRYTTDVIIEEQEFAESKGSQEKRRAAVDSEPEQAADTYPESAPSVNEEGFMSIPEGIQEELPFI